MTSQLDDGYIDTEVVIAAKCDSSIYEGVQNDGKAFQVTADVSDDSARCYKAVASGLELLKRYRAVPPIERLPSYSERSDSAEVF